MRRDIAIVTPVMTGGGWQVFRRFIEAADRPDIRWHIITFKTREHFLPSVAHLRIRSLPYLNYDKYVHKAETSLFWFLLFNLPLSLLSLLSLMRIRPHIALGNGAMATFSATPSTLFGTRVFAWLHTDNRVSTRAAPVQRLIRKLVTPIEHTFVNSEDIRDDLTAAGIEQSSITVVPNWVDDTFFTPRSPTVLRKDKGYRETDFIVLFIGRFVDYKHTRTFLDSFQYIRDNVVFLFVGDGPLRPAVEKAAKSSDRFHYLGKIHEKEILAEYYSLADLTLVYADETYHGLTCYESLACATPVLYPDVSCAPDKYEMGVRIERDLLPPEIAVKSRTDPNAVAEAINRLARTGTSESTRQACRDYAKRYHSSKNAALIADRILSDATAC